MLVLRVRMPIVADLVYPRNFITKIIKYEKACPSLTLHVVHLFLILQRDEQYLSGPTNFNKYLQIDKEGLSCVLTVFRVRRLSTFPTL